MAEVVEDTKSVAPLASSGEEPSEMLQLDESEARSGGTLAPLTFIGAGSGSQSSIRGWQTGKVITRIRVYKGGNTIKAYTIWLTESNGVTFGNPGSTPFSDYTFSNGERVTEMTLWGNGAGTRAGWIEFRTSTGGFFSAGMTDWGRKTAYPVEVGSGVLVGCVMNHGWDIDAHGFYFLNHMAYSQVRDVRYPTLAFDTEAIAPKNLDSFHFTNNASTDREWEFTRNMKETAEETWSIQAGVSAHATISVSAGVPLVAEVNSEFGWTVSATTTKQTSQKYEEDFQWSVKGVAPPGHVVDLVAVTRKGTINIGYTGTMVVTLTNGSSFSYPLSGMYTGVNYSAVRVEDNSTRSN